MEDKSEWGLTDAINQAREHFKEARIALLFQFWIALAFPVVLALFDANIEWVVVGATLGILAFVGHGIEKIISLIYTYGSALEYYVKDIREDQPSMCRFDQFD